MSITNRREMTLKGRLLAILLWPFNGRERRRVRLFKTMTRAYGSWPDGEGL